MEYLIIFTRAFIPVMIVMTILWIISVRIRNAGIVDPFWSIGFIVAAVFYFVNSEGNHTRKIIVLSLVTVWGLRLFAHLFTRFRKSGEEDYRYRNFRNNYGPHRYWWVSFFQVFLLQGVLLWFISAPLLAAMHFASEKPVGVVDILAAGLWMLGFIFEAGGDYQLMHFKANPQNKGKLLTTGFWKYTRHPNYFGDAVVWWAYGLFSIATGSWWPLFAPLLMTLLLLKVSGVSLLERSLKQKEGYDEYMRRTPAFFPWVPRRELKGKRKNESRKSFGLRINF